MKYEQPYVSDELTHFAGRDLDEKKQYKLLTHIIRIGWLTELDYFKTFEVKMQVSLIYFSFSSTRASRL